MDGRGDTLKHRSVNLEAAVRPEGGSLPISEGLGDAHVVHHPEDVSVLAPESWRQDGFGFRVRGLGLRV